MCILVMKKMRHAALKNMLKIKDTQIGIILIQGAVLLCEGVLVQTAISESQL